MPTYNFQKISVKDTKKIKCKKCGKSTQETREFWQTVNPFNKNKDGSVKTIAEIYSEIGAELNEWMKKPLECNKC